MDNKELKELQKGLREDKEKNLYVIAIDESYANSGIAISYGNPYREDGYKAICSDNLSQKLIKAKSKIEYRKEMKKLIKMLLLSTEEYWQKADYKICIVERIRQFSKGFISMDYIKGMGALIAYISEAVDNAGIIAYSVDTRCWKSNVIGTSKPMANIYNVAPEKFPTVDYAVKHGLKHHVFKEISQEEWLKATRRKQPVNMFISESGKYIKVDDDKADSICISLFPFKAMEKGKQLAELLKQEG